MESLLPFQPFVHWFFDHFFYPPPYITSYKLGRFRDSTWADIQNTVRSTVTIKTTTFFKKMMGNKMMSSYFSEEM